MKHPPYCQTRFPLALILNGVTVTPNLFWSTTQETNEGLHLYGAAVSIIEILSLWDEYKKKLLSERGMGFNNCQWCHYFSKSAENTHKIFFFFLLKTIYTYTVRFFRATVSIRWHKMVPCGLYAHGTCKLVPCLPAQSSDECQSMSSAI